MADNSSEFRAIVADIQDSASSDTAVARQITAGALEALRKAGAGSRKAYAGAANLSFGYSAGYGGSWAALPSVLAQNSPLAVLQYTLSRADKLALYRYFSRIDPMVASAIRLHTELPMSKVTISPPKGPSHDQNEQINKIYQNMSDRMDLEQVLMEITRECLICGDVFCWLEWDDEILEWKEAYLLPTEYIHTVLHPFKRNKEFIFFARPLVDTAAVRRMTDRDLYLCVLPHTTVTTYDYTQKRIDQIQEGDLVLSGSGNIKPVLNVWEREVDEEICVIKARGMRDPVRITKNHTIHTLRGDVPAGEIKVGDQLLACPDKREIPQDDINDARAELLGWWLAEGSKDGNKSRSVKFTLNGYTEHGVASRIMELLIREFPPEPRTKKGSKSWVELIDSYGGVNVSRKHCSARVAVRTHYGRSLGLADVSESLICSRCGAPRKYLISGGFGKNNNKPRYQCNVCGVCREVEPLRMMPIKQYYPDKSPEVLDVIYTNSEALKFFISNGGLRAESKKLNSRCMTLPLRQQRILLDAYLKGDGTATASGSRHAMSTSPDLRDQIYWIALRLGMNPRCGCYNFNSSMLEAEARGITKSLSGSRTPKPKYSVSISRTSFLGVTASRTGQTLKQFPITGEGKATLEVLSVEYEPYKGKVYNINVADDHTYHVEGCAVNNSSNDPQLEELFNEVQDDIPDELRASLDFGEGVPLNTDPSKGSCVVHISRNRTPNEQYGLSLLESCIEVLFRLENLKNSQMQISSRNMSPKHLVYGENIGPEQLNDLRAQIDLSLMEPDYVVCTNYPVEWKTIGANDRLLQVETEYQTLREDLATGLGTTKEMLTGAATFGGQRITLEMMNQAYLCYRSTIIDFVEKSIFRPVAEAKGHFFFEEIEEWVVIEPEDIEAGDEIIQQHDGEIRRKRIQENKVYNHSHLRFNRLSIRDNAEVYDQLFMLHQKGSLALKYLLDIHNIDPEENQTALLEDLGTVKDPTFNRLMETLYPAAAEEVIAKTNFTQKIIEGLNLDVVSQNQGEPSPATPTMSGAGDLGMDVMGPSGGGGLGAMPPMGPEGLPPPGGPEINVNNELGPVPPAGDMGVEVTSQGGLGPAPPGMPPTTASIREQAKTGPPVLPGERLDPRVVSRLASTVKSSKWLQRDLGPRAKKKLTSKMIQKAKLDIENETQDVQT